MELTGMHGAGEFYYAVLEGVIFGLYRNYLLLRSFEAVKPQRISISGGITHSPFWMQLAADIFGAALTEDTGEHASLLGAVYMAQYAIGKRTTLKDISPLPGREYVPDPQNHSTLMKRYERWLTYCEKKDERDERDE